MENIEHSLFVQIQDNIKTKIWFNMGNKNIKPEVHSILWWDIDNAVDTMLLAIKRPIYRELKNNIIANGKYKQ